ncbi:Glutamyl-tRNA synthetase [Nitrococcus mobilis Nb-231]|uniref:Glutamate--tRNA ligase n=2 Tax=Nitrococcus mobilis TaxID=35797 RepID=A4BQ92_9GAMM|nr:Glutamyl-tRNA synthetase [Nitrococcus mobilis Nb-231]
MHLGNLRTALFNLLLARGPAGGCFVLRIEDTDRERSSARAATALMQELRWLGLDWDEGPQRTEPGGPWRQSERAAVYAEFYPRLEQSRQAYPCFCSDQELQHQRQAQLAAGRPPRYPGTCRRLSGAEIHARLDRGERPALRFRVPAGRAIVYSDLVRGEQRVATDELGDFIIRRADASAAFLFCNAVDDALMGITQVLRGEDHLANTPRQLLLLEALELSAPRYGHLPMIVGPDGAPLAKRHGSRSVAALREAGYLPGALLNYLARLGHAYGDIGLQGLTGLACAFEVQRIGRAPARFDPQQLDYWQQQAVAEAPIAVLEAWLDGATVPAEQQRRLVEVLRANVRFPSELQDWAERIYGSLPPPDESVCEVLRAAGAGFFDAALRLVDEDEALSPQRLRQATGLRGRSLFLPLRLALTGEPHGPELAELLMLISPQRLRERLRRAGELARAR